MIRIASPLTVWHTYTQDQENITISTTWIFNVFICYFFLISLHKGLQTTLSPLFEQTNLEHVTWTISTHVSSTHGFKSLPPMFWSSTIKWLLTSRLVPQLNARTLFFTLTMVPRSPGHHLFFTFTLSYEALSLLSSFYRAILKSYDIKNPMKNHFFNIVILAWISSRCECWDQSSYG